MPQQLSCACGHNWPPESGPDACPSCGAAHAPSASTVDHRAQQPSEADLEATTAHRPPAAEVPEVAGYQIEGKLGAGGMGVVYRARHLALGRAVALKVVRLGGPDDERARSRFHLEAETVARLQHPNIVQIYEVGEAGGLPYCALELVEGGSLDRRLRKGPLPPAEAAGVVRVLAEAAHLVHSRNIVHRDLKPANVLLAEDGTPKLSDFGLARQLDADSERTQAGAIMGTPSYLAPEQASGDAHTAGPAADVYGLGAVLYHCLTGHPPFRGATVLETLEQVRHQEPASPRSVRADVPADLETVCLKCLRKEPEKRYASALELADDLGRFLRSEPIAARPVGQLERFALWWRRNPALGTLGAALVLLVLATAVGASFAAFHFADLADARAMALEGEIKALAREQQARSKEQDALAKEKEQRLRAERSLGLSSLAEALHAWSAGDVRQARERHARVADHARFWDWHHLRRRFADPPFTSSRHAEPITHVEWSPDGLFIATGATDGTVVLQDARTTNPLRKLAAHKGPIVGLAFSPDGKSLATAGLDGAARVWALPRFKLHRELTSKPGGVTALAWGPAGNWLALGADDGRVRLWDGITGKDGRTLAGPGPPATALAFSPAGRWLARATLGNSLVVLDSEGDVPPLTVPGNHGLLALAFSPDGKLLAGGGTDHHIHLWDASSGALVRELSLYPAGPPVGYHHAVTGLSFRGDGERLASCCGAYGATRADAPGPDRAVRIWSVSGGLHVASYKGPASFSCVRYSPDGQRLAAGTRRDPLVDSPGELRVWDARGDGEYRPFHGCLHRAHSVAFSPDGARLASVGGTGQGSGGGIGELKAWDAATGEVRMKQWHRRLLYSVSFSPDGTRLAAGDADGAIALWDARSGKPLAPLTGGHKGAVHSVAFCKSGKNLVSAGNDGKVCVWGLERGRLSAHLVRKIQHGGHLIAAFLPGGDVLLAERGLFGNGGELLVWAPGGPGTTVVAKAAGLIVDFAISPDGRLLALVDNLGHVDLFAVDGWRKALSFRAGRAALRAVAFSPDGRRLATTAHDGSARLWDVESGREALALTAPPNPAHALAFSPDGSRLAAAGGELEINPYRGDVYVWDAVPAPRLPSSETRPDPAWHLTLTDGQFTPTAYGRAFHAAFAARSPGASVGRVSTLLYDQAAVVEQMKRGGDWRASQAEEQLHQLGTVLASLADAAPQDMPQARTGIVRTLLEPHWFPVPPTHAASVGKAALSVGPGATVEASGASPAGDAYTLHFPALAARGVRLEAFPARPAGGKLGRSETGNFGLSEMEVAVLPQGKGTPRKVALRQAWASYSAKGGLARWAIDGDLKSAWTTWPMVDRDQWLAAETSGPAGGPGDKLLVRLRFVGEHAGHSLARFRLSFTAGPDAMRRERWAAELPKRAASCWTLLAAAAWLRGDAAGTLAACARARALPAGETALDAALRAIALKQSGRKEESRAATARARLLAVKAPADALLAEVLREAE